MLDPKDVRINEALQVITDLGMPRQQQNTRTALCLLALLNLSPDKSWREAESPLIGITPMMTFARLHYSRAYAPNTRETFRRQSMHQLVQAGVALYNPDKPGRSVNSPYTVYQIEPTLLPILRKHGARGYATALARWVLQQGALTKRYAKERQMRLVPIQVGKGQKIHLSAGEHSKLIKAVIEEFAPRFVPGGALVYIGDTGDKWGYIDHDLMHSLGVVLDQHGKMPDVIIYHPERNWLVLVESVTSHGPVDANRHAELAKLFESCKAGLVYVSAFPNRRVMNKYLEVISWETEAWIANAPSHLIHFNGTRFLGPYSIDQ